jgi:dGTPase
MPQTLEGQIVRISDVIAYVNHDVDDALRAEVIEKKDIPSRLYETLGKYHASRIDTMVDDVIKATLAQGLEKIVMSPEIMGAVSELRDFLYERVYYNPHSRGELEKTEKILTDLYHHFLEKPEDYIKPYPAEDPLEKRVGDFIAGMTDRYALRLYERFFMPLSWTIL